MKRWWLLSSCCLFAFVHAEDETFSKKRMEVFYDVFVCEEKSILENFDLSTSCVPSPSPSPTPTPFPPAPPNCPALTTPPNPSLLISTGQTFGYTATYSQGVTALNSPGATAFFMYNCCPAPAPLQPAWSPTSLLPLVITNNTGYSGDVYIVVFGQVPACPAADEERFVFIAYNPDGTVNHAVAVSSADGASYPDPSDYSYPLSYFTGSTVGNATQIYLPPLDGGRIYISLHDPVELVVGANSIAEPSPLFNPSTPSYNTVFDKVEFTYLPSPCNNIKGLPRNQFSFNTTAVDFFGLPIFLYMRDVNGNQSATAGVYQNRPCFLYNLAETFNQVEDANQRSQWNSLFQTATSPPPPGVPSIVRIVSSGDAVTNHSVDFNGDIPPFDPDYLDDAAAYGYSWANDVWTGNNAFYKSQRNSLKCQTQTNKIVYQGRVIPSNNYFRFTAISAPSGTQYQPYYFIPWQDYTSSQQSTTQGFVDALTVFPGMLYGTAAGMTGATSVSTDPYFLNAQELCQAMLVAWNLNQIPGMATITQPNIQQSVASGQAYSANSNLNSAAPWFNLYSQGIHQPATDMVLNNFIYAYPWDDYIYGPQEPLYTAPPFFNVAPGFGTFAEGTYIGIDLRPVN